MLKNLTIKDSMVENRRNVQGIWIQVIVGAMTCLCSQLYSSVNTGNQGRVLFGRGTKLIIQKSKWNEITEWKYWLHCNICISSWRHFLNYHKKMSSWILYLFYEQYDQSVQNVILQYTPYCNIHHEYLRSL